MSARSGGFPAHVDYKRGLGFKIFRAPCRVLLLARFEPKMDGNEHAIASAETCLSGGTALVISRKRVASISELDADEKVVWALVGRRNTRIYETPDPPKSLQMFPGRRSVERSVRIWPRLM